MNKGILLRELENIEKNMDKVILKKGCPMEFWLSNRISELDGNQRRILKLLRLIIKNETI